MNTIPTAKEFWDSKCKTDELKSPGDIMIEFAKMHVEAALKAASEATLLYDFTEEIKNSYPLTNIK